jgi:ferredoxin
MFKMNQLTKKVVLILKYRPIILNRSFCEKPTGEEVNFQFLEEKAGEIIKVRSPMGKSVLDVALEYNVDIEGACGGQMACSTCHCILTQKLYDSLPPKEEEEQDMLDLAWGLKET